MLGITTALSFRGVMFDIGQFYYIRELGSILDMWAALPYVKSDSW